MNEIKTEASYKIFKCLFRADLAVQWRNRRASLISLFVPVIILISWKSVVIAMGGAFALSSAITIGLVAVGLMGYANNMARDREKGIFERLRVTPASTTIIMTSRIAVQILQMAAMNILVFIVAYFIDNITLSAGGYILSFIISLFCGAVFLSMGQAIVGLISSSATVNSVSRFVYIGLVLIGAFGELGVLGGLLKNIILWSPYGSVKILLLTSMIPSDWGSESWIALIVTILYIIIFTMIGIKWFKWKTN